MRELPILAKDSVALNILSGEQTQHRVPMKVQPPEGLDYMVYHQLSDKWQAKREDAEIEGLTLHLGDYKSPWNVGDLLYVREACRFEKGLKGASCVRYRADSALIRTDELASDELDVSKWLSFRRRKGWTGNQIMLKALARTWVKVKRVWVERIQDISEEDCRKEGVGMECPICGGGYCGDVDTYRMGFENLWNSIYGENAWKENKWVWACEFERVER